MKPNYEESESPGPKENPPRWMKETPETIIAQKVLDSSNDPVLLGVARFTDGQEEIVAIKVAGFTGRRLDHDGLKAITEAPLTANMRRMYGQLFPGEPVPVIYSRNFNAAGDPEVTAVTQFRDEITDKNILSKSGLTREWREKLNKPFPSDQTFVLMEYIDNSWQKFVLMIARHEKPDIETQAYDLCLRQFFQLMVAYHKVGIVHLDRKGDDLRFSEKQNRLVVLDWDCSQVLDGHDAVAADITRICKIFRGCYEDSVDDLTDKTRKDFKSLPPATQGHVGNLLQVLRAFQANLVSQPYGVTREGTTVVISRKSGALTAADCLRFINRAITGETTDTLEPEIRSFVQVEKKKIIRNDEYFTLDDLKIVPHCDQAIDSRTNKIAEGISDVVNNAYGNPTVSVELFNKLERQYLPPDFVSNLNFYLAVYELLIEKVNTPDTILEFKDIDDFANDFLIMTLKPDLATSANRERFNQTWKKISQIQEIADLAPDVPMLQG